MRLVFWRTAAPALALALLLVGSRAAVASQCAAIRTNIVTGYALTGCTSPIGVCTTGTMSSPTLLGNTSFSARNVVQGLSPDLLVYSGELVLTFSDGTITIHDQGILNSTTAYYFEVQRVVSGTGAYARAYGLLTSRGVSTPTGFQGVLSGTICYPSTDAARYPSPPANHPPGNYNTP
jgi:hypothetical protein